MLFSDRAKSKMREEIVEKVERSKERGLEETGEEKWRVKRREIKGRRGRKQRDGRGKSRRMIRSESREKKGQ